MKKLLSHVSKKKELTAEYFAQRTIETAQRVGRKVVVYGLVNAQEQRGT